MTGPPLDRFGSQKDPKGHTICICLFEIPHKSDYLDGLAVPVARVGLQHVVALPSLRGVLCGGSSRAKGARDAERPAGKQEGRKSNQATSFHFERFLHP